MGQCLIKLILFNTIICLLISCSPDFRYISKDFNKEIIVNTKYVNDKSKLIKQIDIQKDGSTIVKTFTKDSILISSERYINYKEEQYIGESTYWYENGKIKKIINLKKNGILDGVLKTYYIDGKIKRNDIYKNEKLIDGNCFDSTGNKIKYFPYISEPLMDLALLSECLVYPESMRRQNIQEEVILKILFDKNGKIVKITYDDKNLDEFLNEAIRCILKMKFEPGYLDGEASEFTVFVPISFRLR